MANGAPRSPGALGGRGGKAAEASRGYDADERSKAREATPVTVGGKVFTRIKKDWDVTRIMRRLMRMQEKAIALQGRLQRRIAEVEAEQVEAAVEGKDELEATLEDKIEELTNAADDSTEAAELITYRLIALLLVGPEELDGFGVTDPDTDAWVPAVEFLKPHLDVQDAAAIARELTGSVEPDPQTTPSSGSGST